MKHVVEVQSLVVDKNGRGSWSMDLQGMTCSLNPGDHVAEMEACGRSLAPPPYITENLPRGRQNVPKNKEGGVLILRLSAVA